MIKVKINKLEYVVEFVTKEQTKTIKIFESEDGEEYIGMCDYATQTIYIVEDMQKEERMKQTIAHELAHAIIDAFGLQNKIEDYYDEEFVCDFVAIYARDINKMTDEIYKQYTYKIMNDKTKELEALEKDIDCVHE